MWTPQKRNTHPDTHCTTTRNKKGTKRVFWKKKKKTTGPTISSEHTKDKRKRTNVYEIHNVQCDGVDDFTFTSSHDKTKRKSFACLQLNWETLLCNIYTSKCVEVVCQVVVNGWNLIFKSNKIYQGWWNCGLWEELLSAVFVVFPYIFFFFCFCFCWQTAEFHIIWYNNSNRQNFKNYYL